MRVIGLHELGNLEDFEMTALFVMKQIWKEGQTFVMRQPRRQSAFLWFCGAEGAFLLKNGAEHIVPRGALVLIPQGAEYSLSFSHCTETPSTVLLEFCLHADEAPFVLCDTVEILERKLEERRLIELFSRLLQEYSMPVRPYLSLRSGFYQLFHLLASREERRCLGRRGFRAIEKGIRYLETDEEQDLSIEEIAEMCFVSPAYFRRLFREYAGMPPTVYRTKRKIERAKELMDRSDISVAELSELLRFDNPSYFCRVFKKETGVVPSEYRRSVMRKSIEK